MCPDGGWIVEAEDMKVTQNDSEAIEQFRWRFWRQSFAVDEGTSVRHSFDHDHAIFVGEDAMFRQYVVARQFDMRRGVVHASCCRRARFELVYEALLSAKTSTL
jgi:hypothetical protein